MIMPPFLYVHAGTAHLLDRVRYRLKECWLLVLVLIPLVRRGAGTVVVHNSVRTNQRFTDDFSARRAGSLGLSPDARIDAFGGPTLRHALCLIPAVLMAALPRAWLLRLVRRALRGRADRLQTVVLFFDGHLSGFLIALALRDLGVRVLTLHHGLYLADDRGSMMGIRNFVSDGVLLWNEVTAREYRSAGHDDARMMLAGEYGFGHLSPSDVPADPSSIALCPPYAAADVALFESIANALPSGLNAVFSLHPLLRKQFAALSPRPISGMSPPPAAAICGDSGAIMDCLARGIPVVTVAERQLATAHIAPAEAAAAGSDTWARLIEMAQRNLDTDRLSFGFSDRGGADGSAPEQSTP